jgi:hypothetical protein
MTWPWFCAGTLLVVAAVATIAVVSAAMLSSFCSRDEETTDDSD